MESNIYYSNGKANAVKGISFFLQIDNTGVAKYSVPH